MIGTLAERSLLGALLNDNRQVAMIADLVSGVDFSDGRLGAIFDGIVAMVSLDQPADPITITNHFAEWAIVNLGADEPFAWTTDALSYAAPEYAEAVRSEAIRRGVRTVGMVASERIGLGEDPSIVASEAMRALGSLIDGSVNGRMMPKSLGEVLDVEDEYDWIIDGLLERHDRLVITGPEGGGKSTLVRQLVILPAAGLHPLYFTPMEPISALIVDAENTERQWRRAATWMANRAREAGARDPREFVHIVAGRRIDITSGTDLGQIHRMIDRYEPDLVYIGPLYKLVPNAITNDDDAAPLITALDSLRERGVALVMEAHAGHAKSLGGERDLRPRGSSALLGWPEFGMGIQPIEGEQGFASLVRWRGDRESRSWPTTIKRGLSWPWEPCD